jgi:hypothetical protein
MEAQQLQLSLCLSFPSTWRKGTKEEHSGYQAVSPVLRLPWKGRPSRQHERALGS